MDDTPLKRLLSYKCNSLLSFSLCGTIFHTLLSGDAAARGASNEIVAIKAR